MRPLFIGAALACWAAAASAQTSSSFVNPALAKAYQSVSRDLGTTQRNFDHAIQTLNETRAKQPGNGFTLYMLATAYAQKGDWERAAQALRAGNAAPECIHYVDEGPFRLFPGFARLRPFARDCAAAAPRMGVRKGAALLMDARKMAKRVAAAQPRGLIPVLVGAALRGIADKALVQLYETAGSAADARKAQALQAADKQWADAVRAGTKETLAKTDLENLVRKYFTQDEWQATRQGTVVTPETRKKFEEMTRELDGLERPPADKALKTMPD